MGDLSPGAPPPPTDLSDRALAAAYAPRLLFDAAEPFLPRAVGWSVLRSAGPSPSFRRDLRVPAGGFAVEYAVYWDWDIGHLYDLEHLWVYVGPDGEVADCEGSFHGRYLKGLLPDRSNLSGRRAEFYCQPGKHAFSPSPLVFRLLPGAEADCGPDAGRDGALVGRPLEGRVVREPWWDEAARRRLRARAFVPAWRFISYEFPDTMLVPWAELDSALPDMFLKLLESLR